MDIYMAAVFANNYREGQQRYVKLNDRERVAVTEIPHILESYHYVNKQRYVDEIRRDGAKIFLDIISIRLRDISGDFQ